MGDFLTVISPPYLQAFASGFALTLLITASFLVLGGGWGIVLTMLRMVPILSPIVATYVSLHRNVPLLVQVMFWYFAAPEFLPSFVTSWINQRPSEIYFAILAISLAFGAYASEDLRSGIRSLPTVQYEAARAVGLSYMQAMRLVIIPQAARASLPALTNQFLLFFKGTSIASAIGAAELTHAAYSVNNATYLAYQSFAVATALYLAVSLAIMALSGWLQRRAGKQAR
ncbi:amino acid ABC transporter permease [Mesorhizobium sp. DCY119]|uniref:amino acid ABC transporter permease n=1 Tax=Mesorhizobium sp. DCY119 TaxID=2108445 RepID=UPI001058E709|nr:amino acid ABC transporter permease [Mesorhizobium sp. DCY119]